MAIPKNEYRERIRKLAELARDSGLTGVMLSGETNIDYFSGFRHHCPWTLFARPFYEAIAADGRAAIVGHGFLVPEMRRTGVVEDIRTYPRGGAASTRLLADTLREFGMDKGKVGSELGYEQRLGMSFQEFMDLKGLLPKAELVDAAALLWRLRTIKSPAEVDLMRRSAAVADKAFQAIFAAARPGVSEKELSAIAGATMMSHGAEKPGFALIAAGRENYNCLSGKATERRLEKGEMLWVDLGCVYDGYWSDFCRSAVLGRPSAKQVDYQKQILDVNDACVAAVTAGEPLKRVAEAAQRALDGLGYGVKIGEGRVGHGMGLNSTEPPHTALYEETIMQEGLVFTIEPRFINDDGVFNCEEVLVVTRTGAEKLTITPRELTAIS